MDEARDWFVGDLGDPWVAAIADGLPAAVGRLDAPAGLPEDWPDFGGTGTLVLQRAGLPKADSSRLRRLREGPGGPGKVVLIVGPQGRYHEWEPWAPLVDACLFEATAAATIARHVGTSPLPRPAGPGMAVSVVGDWAVGQTLAEACTHAGFEPVVHRDGRTLPARGLVVAVVPTLEPAWPDVLKALTRGRRVVALLPFADRPTVRRALECGAAACLDVPCDPEDLAFVLGGLATAPRAEPAHRLPPGPRAARAAVAGGNGRA